jgi:hypothetical protein
VIDANFTRTRLLTLRTRNSAAYKGLHALLMRDGAQDFRTGVPIDEASFWDERIDIHHIFPQAWCVKQGIPSQRYNSIVNKAAVSARTNRIIGGQAPSAYLQRIQDQAGIDAERMDQILGTHVIDPEDFGTTTSRVFSPLARRPWWPVLPRRWVRPSCNKPPSRSRSPSQTATVARRRTPLEAPYRQRFTFPAPIRSGPSQTTRGGQGRGAGYLCPGVQHERAEGTEHPYAGKGRQVRHV